MKQATTVKMAMQVLIGGLALSAMADGPTVSDVTVRQRWPWSRLVDIDYVLTGEVGQKADVTITGYNGATALNIPMNAFSGDLYNVEQGFRRIVFDPAKTAYTNQPITQFRVNVHAMATPLYTIVDLTKAAFADGQITYVYESDLTNGLWGAWVRNPVTNNGTAVESVVWTGVTTNDVYKTDKLVLRRIHAGSYGMGDSVNISTTLSKEFYAGVFEVTQRQWELITGTKPSNFNNPTYYASRPVEQVSYEDIRGASNSVPSVNWPVTDRAVVSTNSFLGKLRAKTGLTDFDLPTEAQWECLCRAGMTTVFDDGNASANVSGANANTNAWLDALGRYKFDGGYLADGVTAPVQGCGATNGTAIVGSCQANAWGLYDTHGNVWEWCLDWYAGSLAGGSDPAGAVSGSNRVRRGGSWGNTASDCRSAYRANLAPSTRYGTLGFRLVRALP